MKSFGIAMLIAAVLVGGGIWFNYGIDKMADGLLADAEAVEALIKNDDYKGALDATNKMEELIDDKRILLASGISHENINEIELCLSELLGYCKGEDNTEALVRCKKLEHLFLHLPSNYEISVENIL